VLLKTKCLYPLRALEGIEAFTFFLYFPVSYAGIIRIRFLGSLFQKSEDRKEEKTLRL